jgi:formylglycine-generating enzyme required for sulfatase activity
MTARKKALLEAGVLALVILSLIMCCENITPIEALVDGSVWNVEHIEVSPKEMFFSRDDIFNPASLAVKSFSENTGNSRPVSLGDGETTGYALSWAESGEALEYGAPLEALSTGKTYKALVSFAGKTASFDITILEHTWSTEDMYRRMVTIDKVKSGLSSSPSYYRIAAYETTYELWYEVKEAARTEFPSDLRYNFTFEGVEGHNGLGVNEYTSQYQKAIPGTTPSEDRFEPACQINWVDAVVWCNAYSELNSLTPVYYEDESYQKAARDAMALLSFDQYSRASATVYANPDANGYRLPTVEEWVAAARGGDASKPAWDYKYAGTNVDEELTNYAWYQQNCKVVNSFFPSGYNSTHPVGTKLPVQVGSTGKLYDMCGNAMEWCWDLHSGGRMRYYKGGYYGNGDWGYYEISYVNGMDPYVADPLTYLYGGQGFRVAMNWK